MRHLLLFIIIGILSVLSIVSCDKDENNLSNPQPLKVAAILDMSGHYSQFGQEARQAMEMALEQTGQVAVQYYDSKGQLDVARQNLDQITEKAKADVVVTLASWISNGLSDEITDHGMMQIAVGSAVFDHASSDGTVRFTSDVAAEGAFLIDQLRQYDSIAVMYFANDYGNGWMTTLQQGLGDKIVTAQKYEDTQIDFTGELEAVRSSGAQVTVLISTSEAALITAQASEMEIHTQFIGTRPTLTQALLDEPAAEGLVFSYPDLNTDLTVYDTFRDRYGYHMAAFGAEGYDVIGSLSQHENPVTTSDELYDSFIGSQYQGALGNIQFDDNGQASYPFTMMKIEDGTFVKK